MSTKKNTGSLVYVIDEKCRIVYSSDELNTIVPEYSYGQPCYQVLCHEQNQCRKCPLREENQGKSIVFNRLHNAWFSVSASPIEWPGAGKCHVVICERVEDNGKSFFYKVIGEADYDELLELNYPQDRYSVVYHSERENPEANEHGTISAMLRRVAENLVHPDDRNQFYDFWLFDQIGTGVVPEELFQSRHAEFRKLKKDGSYGLVQQVLMPARKGTGNSVYIMSFYNVLEEPEQWNDKFADVTQDVWENGLYSKQSFLRCTEELLKQAKKETLWCIVAIDIEKLKLFNEWYGKAAGDEVLKGVAVFLKDFQEREEGIAGYFGNDDFAILMPYDVKKIAEIYDAIADLIKSHSEKMNVLPALGVYEIVNKNVPAFTMYDRANLACTSVKGDYTERIKRFDHEMLQDLQSEYLLLSNIQKAFQNKEFTFFLQPKCNMKNGKLVGAEALVRWNSQEKGLIPPGAFIPFLEKTGFIAELDTYVWEEVCRWQRRMLDSGMPTLPVSVNVSRTDLYSVDVPAYFRMLIERYDLSPTLIEVEITESAYAADDGIINQKVEELREAGFRVLMDDFGSAYSSLNMLKDITVDVLKMDMRFLNLNGANAGRGIDILETVSNMAKILGLGLVVEGVETEEQKNFLLKVGCSYGQGYYFYRPMPQNEFEKLLADSKNLDSEDFYNEKMEHLYLKDLLSQNLLSENMLDNMLGAVAFYDVYEGKISVARYNEQYAAVLGNKTFSSETEMRFGEQLYEEEYSKIFKMFEDARNRRHLGAETDIRRRRPDGTDMWLNLRTFFLHEQNGHAVYYSSVTDVTKLHRSNEVLRFLNNDMPGGYFRYKNTAACDFQHISQRFLNIFGYTRQEIREQFDDKFINMVHPEDRNQVWQNIRDMDKNGGNYSQRYRMRAKSGYIFVISQSRLSRYNGQEIFQGIILIDLDYPQWLERGTEDLDELSAAMQWTPCGIFESKADDDRSISYVSSGMLAMLGYSEQEFRRKFNNSARNMICEGDRIRVRKEAHQQLQAGVYVSSEYRIELADGSLKWFYSRGRLVTREDGTRWFHACIVDCDYLRKKYTTQDWDYLKYKILFEIPGMIVYDYDPAKDCLTIDFSSERGEAQTLVARNYMETIGDQAWVAKESVEKQRELLQEALRGPVNGTAEFKVRFREAGEFQWYRFRYISLADESGNVYRMIGRAVNVHEEMTAISGWRNRARTDSLTGLLNYKAAWETLTASLKKCRAGILFLLDIDNFKEINDTMGHQQGDVVLKEIADTIHSCFRRGDVLARQGGDEFMIFMPEACSYALAEGKAAELMGKIQTIPVKAGVSVSCSIGIAVTEAPISVEALMREADMALYQAKREGKNKYVFFEPEKNMPSP